MKSTTTFVCLGRRSWGRLQKRTVDLPAGISLSINNGDGIIEFTTRGLIATLADGTPPEIDEVTLNDSVHGKTRNIQVWPSGQVQAEYVIALANKREVTTRRYVDEGQTIKIYTDYGAISFRKADVRRITEVSGDQTLNIPPKSIVRRSSGPEPSDALNLPTQNKKMKGTDRANMGQKKNQAEENRLSEADLARLDEQYYDVDQRFDTLWQEYRHQVRTRVPTQELAKYNQQPFKLDQTWQALKKKVRRQTDPNTLPVWAQ